MVSDHEVELSFSAPNSKRILVSGVAKYKLNFDFFYLNLQNRLLVKLHSDLVDFGLETHLDTEMKPDFKLF